MVVKLPFLGRSRRPGRRGRVFRIIQRSLRLAGLAVLVMMTFFSRSGRIPVSIYDETLSLDSPARELIHRTRDYSAQKIS